MFVVFDLDGTLANDTHRRNLIVRDVDNPKDYEAYHSRCAYDEPNHPVVEVARMVLERGHDVEIWTARPEKYRPETDRWLQEVFGATYRCILETKMRPDGDSRSSNDLKGQWLDECKPHLPDIVFDDRAKCVNFYRNRGIPTFQVADNT